MRVLTKEELQEIIDKHKHWLNKDCEGWESMKADLSDTVLNGVNLRGVDLYGANLSRAKLCGADLSGADLSWVNLRYSNLRGADLSSADLSSADLRGADLSCAKNVLSPIDYLKENFEFTSDGIVAYKVFNGTYTPPKKWVIQSGSIITENCDSNRTEVCGCGINVASLEWIKRHYTGDIWEVLIRWEWLAGVVVPYNTDGKIRCERCELLEIVER
jgi:hypothetical protein